MISLLYIKNVMETMALLERIETTPNHWNILMLGLIDLFFQHVFNNLFFSIHILQLIYDYLQLIHLYTGLHTEHSVALPNLFLSKIGTEILCTTIHI